MSVTEEQEPDAFQQRDQELAERGEWLRRINERIRHLKAELDALNARAPRGRDREGRDQGGKPNGG